MKTFKEILRSITENLDAMNEAAGVSGRYGTSSHKVALKANDSLQNKDHSASKKVKFNLVKKEKRLDNQANKSSK